MYCFSGENKWFWEEMDERVERNYTFCSKCVVFGGKDTMCCALMLQKKSFYYVPPLTVEMEEDIIPRSKAVRKRSICLFGLQREGGW